MNKEFTINQDISLLSDEFSLVGASLADLIDGKEEYVLLNGFAGDNLTTFVGFADKHVTNRSGSEFTLSVQGRDGLKFALRTWFQKTYFFTAPGSEIRNKYDEPIPWEAGNITASHAARQACAAAGLDLIWDAPDYPLVSAEIESAGFADTVADVLIALVQPLQLSEMFRLDIVAHGTTVIVKKRRWPYVADYEIPLTDALISAISLSRVSDDKTPIRNIYMSKDEVREFSLDTQPAKEEKIIETLDVDGKVLTREIITSYYFYGLTVKEERLVYNRLKGSQDVTLAEANSTVYDYGNSVSTVAEYNKLFSKETAALVYDPHPDQFSVNPRFKSKDVRTVVNYTYSPADEIIVEDTVINTREFNSAGTFKIDTKTGQPINTKEQTTLSYHSITKDMIEITKAHYVNGVFVDKQRVTQSGQMPGPKKVGRNKNRSSNNTTFWSQKIVVNEFGKDVEISDQRFTREQLQQFGRELSIEKTHTQYWLDLGLIPMPWIRKGQTVRFTGTISDGLGNTFSISDVVFLITKNSGRLTDNSYTGTLEAIGWL